MLLGLWAHKLGFRNSCLLSKGKEEEDEKTRTGTYEVDLHPNGAGIGGTAGML